MQAKYGFQVGKRGRTKEWIEHGVEYYKQLLVQKGDVYKFRVLTLLLQMVCCCCWIFWLLLFVGYY